MISPGTEIGSVALIGKLPQGLGLQRLEIVEQRLDIILARQRKARAVRKEVMLARHALENLAALKYVFANFPHISFEFGIPAHIAHQRVWLEVVNLPLIDDLWWNEVGSADGDEDDQPF